MFISRISEKNLAKIFDKKATTRFFVNFLNIHDEIGLRKTLFMVFLDRT
jgi:hypothetical protein